MNSYKLFLKMLVTELSSNKNFRGIIYEEKERKITSFSYIDEIDTFFVATEYENDDIAIINNDLTKKDVIKAFQNEKLYMFDFLDEITKQQLEIRVDEFVKTYFTA